MEHLVILGNGIAGVTTARHVRKRSDIKITIISNETDHFFSRTALMYIFMGHMKYEHTKPYEDWFWQKNRLNLVRGFVSEIDTDNRRLIFDDGKIIEYDKLVIATGSKGNKFGWPGQNLPGVQGLYSFQDLELLEKNSADIQRAVIVGGGLIGIELAEMLLSRNIPVTMLVRENYYWDNILPENEAKLISRHVRAHGIDLRLKTNLKEIVAGKDGRARAVITEFDEDISCQLVGLTPGVHPNIDIVKNSKIETNRGVLVNDFLETNIPGVYACGDCVEIVVEGAARNRIEQLWYTGRIQGQALAKTICGESTKYERGIWFNSAKFLDIEYQTYGFVSNVSREGEKSFYWEHPDGQKCIHIVYRETDQSVVGVNVFGIRMRHKVWEKWLRDRCTLEFILQNLPDANFDPEFYRAHEPAILTAYQQQTGRQLQLKQKPGFLKRLLAV